MPWFESLFSAGRSYDDSRFRQGVGGPQGWMDAFRPIQIPSYPEPPQEVRSYKDLDAETRKQDRRDMWLSVAAALAEGADSGRLGSALARAAQTTSERRKASLGEENARRRGAWERDVAKTDREARLTEVRQVNQDREQKAKALFETWRQAQEGIDVRDRPLYRRAATLAEAGDLSGLQKLLAEAPGRKSLLDKGVDPDDEMSVALYRQRALDAAQLEGRLADREALDPLDIKKAVETRKALTPFELQQAEQEAQIRRRYRADEGGGAGRQLEGRVVQREDGSYYVIDQTAHGAVTDPVTGLPLKGKKEGLRDKAVEMAMREKAEHDKLSPLQKQQQGAFNLRRRVEEIEKDLEGAYGVSRPEGGGAPVETGDQSKKGVPPAVVAQRVALVDRTLPNMPAPEKQEVTRRLLAGESAAKIVREKAFPGLPQNLWKEVEDDLRAGRSLQQIQAALRRGGVLR